MGGRKDGGTSSIGSDLAAAASICSSIASSAPTSFGRQDTNYDTKYMQAGGGGGGRGKRVTGKGETMSMACVIFAAIAQPGNGRSPYKVTSKNLEWRGQPTPMAPLTRQIGTHALKLRRDNGRRPTRPATTEMTTNNDDDWQRRRAGAETSQTTHAPQLPHTTRSCLTARKKTTPRPLYMPPTCASARVLKAKLVCTVPTASTEAILHGVSPSSPSSMPGPLLGRNLLRLT